MKNLIYVLLLFINIYSYSQAYDDNDVFDSLKVNPNEIFSISINGKGWTFDGDKGNKKTYKFFESHSGDGYQVFTFSTQDRDVYYFIFNNQDLKNNVSEERIFKIYSGEISSSINPPAKDNSSNTPNKNTDQNPSVAIKKDNTNIKNDTTKPTEQNKKDETKIQKDEDEPSEFDNLITYNETLIETKIKEYKNLKDEDEKISKLEDLVLRIPQYKKLDGILFEIGKYYDKKNKIQTAAGFFISVIEKFPLGEYGKQSRGILEYYIKFYPGLSFYKERLEKIVNGRDSKL